MIPPINGATAGAASSVAGASQSLFGSGLDKDDFLLLLVTQLRHQDPLDPLEAQDFASQLAEFTAMEQQLKTNELIQSQIDLDTAAMIENQNSVAVGLIGNSIVAQGDFTILSGASTEYAAIATTGPATFTLELVDDTGTVVHTMPVSVGGGGVHHIDLGATATNLPPGRYEVRVDPPTTANGVDVTSLALGDVSGVRWGAQGPVLVVGGEEILLSNVLEITT